MGKYLLEDRAVAGTISRITTQDNSGTGVTSASATYAATPTPGNLLIAVIGTTGDGGLALTNTGWSVGYESGAATDVTILYKVAGASEPTTITTTTDTLSTSVSLAIYEYTGFTGTPTLDRKALGNSSSSATVSTGTTPSTGATNELLFAAVEVNASAAVSLTSWTNSFTTVSSISNSNTRLYTAQKSVTAIGTYETTLTVSSSVSQMYAAIVTFKDLIVNTTDAYLLEDGSGYYLLEARDGVSYLTDNFNDNSTDTTKWTVLTTNGTVAEQNARLEVAANGTAFGYSGYQSKLTYDLTSSVIYVQVPQTTSANAGAETMLRLNLSNSTDTDYIGFVKGGGSFIPRYKVGGTQNDIYPTYDATNHAWWRISHDGTNIVWDSAPDSGGVPGTWTNQRTVALSTIGLSITAVYIELLAGQYQAVTGGSGTAYFDNLNTTAAVTLAKAATLTDTFSSTSTDTSKWTVNGTNYSQPSGQLEIGSVTGTTTYTSYNSAVNYDLTSSYAYAQLIDAGNQSLASWQAIPVQIYASSTNTLSWVIGSNTLYAQQQLGGTYTNVRGDTAYNSAVHKFFRIREAAGTTYYDYSTDGTTWTNYTSMANPFPLSNVNLRINAGTYNSEASASNAFFDNFNATPTGTSPSTAQFFLFF